MSEQHENTERRLREALLAEAGDAPAPPDLWARVAPQLERPVAPVAGWRRRWSMMAAGAAAAAVLVVGGSGTALIATGLSVGSEDRAWLAFSGTDERLSGVDNAWSDVEVSDDISVALDDPWADRDVRIRLTADSPGVLGPPGAPGPDSPPASETASAVPLPTQSGSGSPQDLAGERQIISQASLDLEVSDVNAAATQLRGLVESFGGFIEHVSTSGGPNPEYGSAVVRVPGDRFLDALDSIERLGKALGQTLGQRDVTGEAIDLEARLKSERSAEESLLKLLERAVSVSDVLTVERELSRVRADIERLQGQLEFIQRSVALATIAVSFVLPPGAIPSAPSASLQIEVDDVERSANRVRGLVDGVGGTMGRVIVSTHRDGQYAALNFQVPTSAFDNVLASLAEDGVVLQREVQSDGGQRQIELDDDLQARVVVHIQTPEDFDPWRSIGVPVAGGLLVLLSVVGAVALVLRARRRRA